MNTGWYPNKKQALILLMGLGLVFLVSYFQYKNWRIFHADNMEALLGASYGVLDGTPHWRAYQNRILGPLLIHVLGYVANEPFYLFMKAGFLALNLFVFGAVFSITEQMGRASLAVLGAALLWVLQNHYWAYPWDLVEAITLVLLVYFALRETFNFWTGLIVVLAALNKETAMLIGLFFVLRGLALKLEKGRVDVRQICLGLALSMASLALTEGLRHVLFNISSLQGIGQDPDHANFGNHWVILENWHDFKTLLAQPSALTLMMLFFLAALLTFLWKSVQSRQANRMALSGALVLYVVALGLFGLIRELRVFQPLMGCLAVLLACSGADLRVRRPAAR